MKLEHSGVASVQAHTQDSTSNLVVIMRHTHVHRGKLQARQTMNSIYNFKCVYRKLPMSVEKAKLNVTPWTLNELKAWALESESAILLDPLLPPDRKRVF